MLKKLGIISLKQVEYNDLKPGDIYNWVTCCPTAGDIWTEEVHQRFHESLNSRYMSASQWRNVPGRTAPTQKFDLVWRKLAA